MKRIHLLFSILLLPSLLSNCAGTARAEKALEDYRMATDVPTKPELTATAQTATETAIPLSSCPITRPQEPPFVPPAPYSDLGYPGYFWYGSNDLWTSLREDGAWTGLPHNPEGMTQKVFWWRDGYIWNEEPQPDLRVTGERLDAEAPLVHASRGTNAYAEDIGSAMLVGMDFPTPGCWKITGEYRDEELSFVVWVAP